jgi:hypothetical protein
MDSVGRLNGVIEVLRRQIAENSQRMDKAEGRTLGSQVRPTGPGAQARPNLAELKLRIQTRLRHIDPADPDKAKKSQKVFLESVLAWEFGESLLLDRNFDEMLGEIQKSLASQPDVEKQLADLLAILPENNT